MGAARSARGGALILSLVFLLTACPDGPVEDDPAPSRPVRGGILKVAVRDLSTLDPAKARGRGAFTVISQVFDSLTAIDPRTGTLQPAAASSWRSSPTGKTWRFKLARRTFHDGRRVTAKDFERAFDRIARKRTDSDAAFQLEQVAGFRALHTLGRGRALSGVVARGSTLKITLSRPFRELPFLLAHPALGPLHPRYARSLKGISRKPIGNGPFRVDSSRAGREATLSVYEDYRGNAGYLDGLEFRVAGTLDEGWRLFDDGDGEVDVADVPARSLAAARARYDEGGFTPVWATLSFGPNLKLRKYRKPEVRKAISLAIDRKAIASTVYGNTKDPATGIVPRGVRGFRENVCTVCEQDVRRARGLIRSAFGRKPPTIRIDHLDDDASKLVATAVGNDLKGIGLKVRLRSYGKAKYFRLLSKGTPDLAELGWISDVPTQDGFLAQQLGRTSSNNSTGYRNAGFERLIAKARRTRDGRARLVTYRKAEIRALRTMPLVPIVFFRNRTAASERVNGFWLDGAGIFDATKVWLRR